MEAKEIKIEAEAYAKIVEAILHKCGLPAYKGLAPLKAELKKVK